ncbi:pyridoxal phosphate-dependent aminotransferase [uncultured Odoribacter sp.]|uniref:pyridoxal phosphate-dependent aminotransferase n=1 Tax=uncultured Odoribacter sp. TaxID=876416 RepID=UPI00260A2989|nr:pyridoxal phosphate-dependent aminotransferase [uncultured Odoribacter sp.]
MQNNIIDQQLLETKLSESAIHDMQDASIRDVVKVANLLEKASGYSFIRMEMGVPGLPPSRIGTEAEIEALKLGVAQFYPMLEGYPSLSEEAARFIQNFIDIRIQPAHIIPTVGAMQASYTAFMALTECNEGQDTVLFIDPGFSVQKTQLEVIGKPYETFDIFEFRGEKLRAKLEEYLTKGNICAIVYSNPNNPAWICLNEAELQIIGELANKYNIIVLEDLAYFAMDFRKDLSHPGVAPFQPTVARYTDNYILMISSSKLFSYAGQRLGLLCVSDTLYAKKYPHLKKRYKSEELGYTLVYKLIYTQTSGTAHSPQYAVAAILKAANEGQLDILKEVREYGQRAHIMKTLFREAGFEIVYDKDGEEQIGDGFYFTIGYPGMKGGELAKELLYYGISSLPLKGCGSKREGLRACVSQVSLDKMELLKERLDRFKRDHGY